MRIEVQGLHARLGGREVLRGVDLMARPGELSAIVGPNGAGKSTLLRAIVGLVPPTRGTVGLDGRDAALWERSELSRALGYLPQERIVHWPLQVRVLVGLGRLPHQSFGAGESDRDRAAIDAALAVADVSHLADRSILELSGGERARVLLARALAQEPRALLADEPAAGLDPAHQLALFEHLSSIAAAGRTVVIALHDLSFAARFCHNVVLVHEGCAFASGAPERVLTPQHLAAVYGIRAHYHIVDGVPVVLPLSALP
jgi:iron complex transport system ATP-binding protein